MNWTDPGLRSSIAITGSKSGIELRYMIFGAFGVVQCRVGNFPEFFGFPGNREKREMMVFPGKFNFFPGTQQIIHFEQIFLKFEFSSNLYFVKILSFPIKSITKSSNLVELCASKVKVFYSFYIKNLQKKIFEKI